MKGQHSPSLMEGLRHSTEMVVKNTDLDIYWGLGDKEILAIPILISMIERTTNELINPYIDNKSSTIGIEFNLKHLSSAVLGDKLKCNIQLKFIEENNLFFDISVSNEDKIEIAHGAHERQIV